MIQFDRESGSGALWLLFADERDVKVVENCARSPMFLSLLNQFEADDQVTKTNKLKGITEITLNLDELNNSINLKDGRPSNELLTYHVTDDKDFTRFEPQTPQYRKLKNGELTSLNLRITDQNNNIISDGLQVTVVLHIRDRKI